MYITGQTGFTLDGELRHPYDAAGQTRLACENIKQLMEMAGGTMDDVVRYVVYTTDRAYREQVYPIFKSYFTIPPCGTGLIVDRRTKVMGRRLSVSTLASRGANRDQVGQAAHAVAEDPCRPAAAAAMVAHDRHFLDRQALLLRSEQQLDIEAW